MAWKGWRRWRLGRNIFDGAGDYWRMYREGKRRMGTGREGKVVFNFEFRSIPSYSDSDPVLYVQKYM
jgi:hypothetical protein